ncbi:putative transcriptional regulator [Ancylobacter sp. 3268]|uniref:helix-turn-helix domain-containing protein n=1 Tax=Ancylobacter sp. 3268 TaxID=2817752 RepID=UPI00285A7A8C|nr:helix-turn-helix transcriptional regulator [Ancylobacter sp. 3268]MDR6954903.1 putative transcriptional regulator [Ancylobacter sp. 3268]
MNSDKPHRSPRADELEQARLAAGVSQRAVARDLGITQGHYSKVVDGLVRDRKSYVERALQVLSGSGEGEDDVDRLVRAATREIRASPSFRNLVAAALRYSRPENT